MIIRRCMADGEVRLEVYSGMRVYLAREHQVSQLTIAEVDELAALISDAPRPLVATEPTLRDRFAMAALSGIPTMDLSNEDVARTAYAVADAMLAARGGK